VAGQPSLAQVTAILTAMGLDSFLRELLSGPLERPRVFYFSTLKTASRTQALLYRFLWFHPEAKARLSLKLDKNTGALTVTPRSTSEKRGRKGAKR